MEETKASVSTPSPMTVDNLIDVDTDVTIVTNSNPATPTNTATVVILTPLTTSTAQLEAAPTQAQDTNNKAPTLEWLESQKKSLPTIDEMEASQTGDINEVDNERPCSKCNNLEFELKKIKAEKLDLEQTLASMRAKLQSNKDELEREVQKRVDLEQRFTEEAKWTTEQIEELIAKSDSDDARLNELRKRFEVYSRETSSMIENFTTNREVLTSQLLELRQENDYLLGKYLTKSRDLQSADIDLPQSVEELQFHCLTLYEKLILSTMAKERLEETLMLNTNQSTTAAQTSITPNTANPSSPP
jgi:predicted  nucleic acid-binding Zn-ribbon protein